MKRIFLTLSVILIVFLFGCHDVTSEKEGALAKSDSSETKNVDNLSVTQYDYKSAYNFDLAIVSIDGKEGVIDNDGNYLVELGKI